MSKVVEKLDAVFSNDDINFSDVDSHVVTNA